MAQNGYFCFPGQILFNFSVLVNEVAGFKSIQVALFIKLSVLGGDKFIVSIA